MNARELDIVIVSRNTRDLLAACLDSLRAHPLRSGWMTVHVADNASDDGTEELVRERFPEVRFEQIGWNSGFCVANNRILATTAAPWALLLNPDTEMSEGALDHCLDEIEARPDVGVLGC